MAKEKQRFSDQYFYSDKHKTSLFNKDYFEINVPSAVGRSASSKPKGDK